MRRYLFSRLGQNLLTFFLFLTLVYVLIDAQPGSYADQYLNDPRLTPETTRTSEGQPGIG